MLQLPILHRLLIDRLPLRTEKPIIQVHHSLPNDVISEQIIVVIGLDDQGRGARELHVEVEVLEEFGVGLVQLVVLPVVVGLLPASHHQVRVRERPNVSLSQVEALNEVHTGHALGLGDHHLADHVLVGGLLEEGGQLQLSQADPFHHHIELGSSFGSVQLFEVKLELLIHLLLVDLPQQVLHDLVPPLLRRLVALLVVVVVHLDDPLELPHFLYGGDLAGVVGVGLAEEAEEALGGASGLPPLHLALMERQLRDHFLHLLQFIGVVPSVVLFAVFGVLVEAEADEEGGGRGVDFPLDLEALIKRVLRVLNVLMGLAPGRLHILQVFLPLVGELLFLVELVFSLPLVEVPSEVVAEPLQHLVALPEHA
mmetsp:Transcript_30279/g.29595  ORF Transcript_30279/g.29595 Transcript_30279/m.29595 type:complete len:368 (+) Transcript_30279:679-1782(+)